MAYDVASMAVHAYKGDAAGVKMDQAAFVTDGVGLMLPGATGLGLAARAAEQEGVKLFYAGTKETVQTRLKGAQGSSTHQLNSPINISEKGLQHTTERHTDSGIDKFEDKSKFNPDVDLKNLIQ